MNLSKTNPQADVSTASRGSKPSSTLLQRVATAARRLRGKQVLKNCARDMPNQRKKKTYVAYANSRRRCDASFQRCVPRPSRRVTKAIDGLALALERVHDVQGGDLGRAARGTHRQCTCCEPPMAAIVEPNPGLPAATSFRCYC